MQHSRMSLASRQPLSFHCISHGTVLSTCCLGLNSLKVEYTPYPSWSSRQWRITSGIHPTIHLPGSLKLLLREQEGLRASIDYRMLNSQMVKLPYPLPLVPAALEELFGAHVFSKLDLRSAYNLVRIREGDEWKTAFITPAGHYKYRVMPCGLSNSPSVFQGFMNEVFWEFHNKFVIVYIDDILTYSRNLAEHRYHVTQVLQKLRQHKLYLKLEKCEFHRSTVPFLRYIISQKGIQMDRGKVKAIREWPLPQSVKELQRFLGFANFYRWFVKNFSMLTAPLTSLLRGKPKPLSWNSQAHEAFDQLKEAFNTATILRYPDPQVSFVVEVDASTTCVGLCCRSNEVSLQSSILALTSLEN